MHSARVAARHDLLQFRSLIATRVSQLSAQELGGLLTRAMEATAGLRAPAQRNPVARGTTLGQEVQMWPWAPKTRVSDL